MNTVFVSIGILSTFIAVAYIINFFINLYDTQKSNENRFKSLRHDLDEESAYRVNYIVDTNEKLYEIYAEIKELNQKIKERNMQTPPSCVYQFKTPYQASDDQVTYTVNADFPLDISE